MISHESSVENGRYWQAKFEQERKYRMEMEDHEHTAMQRRQQEREEQRKRVRSLLAEIRRLEDVRTAGYQVLGVISAATCLPADVLAAADTLREIIRASEETAEDSDG